MKKITCAVLLLIVLFLFCGCQVKTGNRITAGLDVQTFDYAYVSLDGTMIAKGYVSQWRDYDDSEAIQVMIDGKYYLTEYTNVVLIADPSIGSLTYGDTDTMYGVQ